MKVTLKKTPATSSLANDASLTILIETQVGTVSVVTSDGVFVFPDGSGINVGEWLSDDPITIALFGQNNEYTFFVGPSAGMAEPR